MATATDLFRSIFDVTYDTTEADDASGALRNIRELKRPSSTKPIDVALEALNLKPSLGLVGPL